LKAIKYLLLSSLLLITVTPLYAAKYAGEFLSLGVGGRPISLGGAFVAESGDVLCGYYNPAGLSMLENTQAVFMHSETFGSILNHDFLAYARPVGSGENKAAIAISLYRLGGGGIIVTAQNQTDSSFYKVSEESHADYAGYISYSRKLGQRFSAGVSGKLIYRSIIDESAYGIGLDLGGLYTLSDWADVGLNLQDIATTLLSYSTGTKESIFPTAKLGLKLHGNYGRFFGSLYTDGDFRFEDRDYAAQFSAGPVSLDSHTGIEISYLEKIAARIGADDGNLTLGAGLRFTRFHIDAALRDHSELDNTFLASLTANF
jgi:hypothetical protein